MSVREADDPQLFARVQEQNLLRQYDLLANCVEIALKKGIESFDKYMLWFLNAAAVSNIAQFGGRFREHQSMLATISRRTSRRCRTSSISVCRWFTKRGPLTNTLRFCRRTCSGASIGSIH